MCGFADLGVPRRERPSYLREAELEATNRKEMSQDSWQEVADEVVALLKTKQKDYGPNNILSTGHIGLAVRLNDKAARLLNLIQQERDPKNESVRDTYLDMAGYGIIGVLLLDGKFPPKEEE